MKKTKLIYFAMIFSLMSLFGIQNPAFSFNPSSINLADYPEMDNREIGHLLYYSKIAAQELGDFRHMKSPNLNMIPGTGDLQFRESAYRYQLAFMVYFLAMEQYHKLPACLNIIQPKMDRLIQKMLHRDVWKYWGEWVSKGLFIANPDLLPFWAYPERHDPIGDDNVMYSSHLAQMVGLYEKLYRDFKWSKPNSMVFKWSGSEVYYYDTYKIQTAMLDQALDEQVCLECEPNFCFAMCNTHPILAFKLYDDMHGTNHYDQTRDRFIDWMYEKDMISPDTYEIATFHLIKQDITVIDDTLEFGNILDSVIGPLVKSGLIYGNLAANDGWTGYFMNAFAPEIVQRLYHYWMENHVIEVNKDLADTTVDRFEDQLGIGFFAMLMAEVGEKDYARRLVNMAQLRYRPVWGLDGSYNYPYFTDQFLSGGPISRFTANGLTDKLMANALATPAGGVKKLYMEPFITQEENTPIVTRVDFPKVVLKRAIYDKARNALIITTEDPWWKMNYNWQKTSLRVERLNPSKTYELFVDGKKEKIFSGRSSLDFSIKLVGKHNIILAVQ